MSRALEPGRGQCLLVAARPRGEPDVGHGPRGFHAQPGQRRARRGLRTGGLQRRSHPVPALTREVLQDDGVKDDGAGAGDRRRDLGFDPLAGVGLVDADGMAAGQVEGTAQPVQPLDVVRPHERHQREASVIAQRVDRRDVTASTVGDGERATEIRRPIDPHVVEHQWTGRITDLDRAGHVAVALPAQQQPRRATDLPQSQRQPGSTSDQREARDEDSSAADLVGLHAPGEAILHLATMSGHRGEERRRGIAGHASSGRRVELRQLGRPTVEDDPVHRAEQAEHGSASCTGRGERPSRSSAVRPPASWSPASPASSRAYSGEPRRAQPSRCSASESATECGAGAGTAPGDTLLITAF